MLEFNKCTRGVFSMILYSLWPIWFLFLKTRRTPFLVFFENCYCFLNLVFFMFFRTKNKGKQTCFLCFFYSHCFIKQKTI